MFSKLRSRRARRVVLDLLHQLTKAEEACRRFGATLGSGRRPERAHSAPLAVNEPQHPIS
jgi:hypothetical protein